MKGKKVISRLTKVFYALGIVMLLSGMMLSAITSPALAQEQATQAASEGEEETSSDPTATPVPDEGSPDPTEEPDDEEGSGEPMGLQASGPALAVVAGPALSSVCKDDGSVEWWVTGTQGGVTYTLTSDLFSDAISLRNKNSVLVYTGPASSAYSVSVTWTLPGGETGELYDEATADMCGEGDEDPEWSKSSLSFEGSCVGDCEEVSAEVCNVGDGDMSGSVDYNVYYAASGNPKNGTIVNSGTVGPLAHGECADLTYTPTEDGNYMFQAFQEAGHPGTGELWSSECSVDQCSVPEEDEFTWTLESEPDSASCQIEAGQMCTTFVVELHNIPVGYSVVLQTTFHQVWPDNGDDKVYSSTTLGNVVNEVEVCGLWPGIGDGNHMVEIHFGGKLFLVDPSGNRQDLSGGNYDAEGVDFWYHPSMKEECEIPEEPVLEITETCPDFVNMQNKFIVSNTGSVDAYFDWSSDNGVDSGTGVFVEAGDPTTITTTRGATPDTVTITFGSYGSKSATAMTEEDAELAECTLPEKPSLTIIATCPDFDDSLNAWLITNTGNVAIDFTWSSSEGESGSGSVGIGGTANFTTPRGVTVETVTVSYGDGKTASADSMTEEDAEEAECQVPQVPVLGLTSTCPDYLEDLNNWTITNIGPVATSYSWTSTTGESGSGTLGVSESVNFSTDRSLGPDEVTVTYGTDKSVKETAMTDEDAEAELCEMPPELTWKVQGEGDYTFCEWDSLTTCTTFIVNLSNLGEDESAFLRTTFEEVLPDASSPVVTTTDLGNGDTEVTVCGTWPGIAYGDHNVEIRFTAELVVVRGGDEEVLSETPESVTIWYDSETMKDQCEVPELQPVLLLDPYCVDVEGEWGMAWVVENPNAIDIEYTWDFPEISGATGSDIVLANDPGMLFYVSPLGTHKADVTWGDGQIASLEFTITTCEETPPTDDPTPVPTPPVNPPEFIPVTAVEQVEPPPVVDAGLLIPVTGVETSASQNGGFFQKLLYNIGFAFMGIGLIFSGLQRKFDK